MIRVSVLEMNKVALNLHRFKNSTVGSFVVLDISRVGAEGPRVASDSPGPDTPQLPRGHHTCSCLQRNFSAIRIGCAIPIPAGLVELAQLALAFSGNLEEPPGQFDRPLLGVHLQNCES